MLAKGLNYNTTDAKKLDFIADLESALKNTELTKETKNNIRHQVTTNLLHLSHLIDLTKQEREALEDLKKDDDIVILPADKRRMTVVMDKSDYTNKAKTLINDTNTYQPLDTDPSKTTVNSINKKLKSLKDQDKLNKRTYDQIRPKDAAIAKFYGLPKIHKDNKLRLEQTSSNARDSGLDCCSMSQFKSPRIIKSLHLDNAEITLGIRKST